MRKIVLWGLSTLSVLVLLFGYSTSTAGPLATSAETSVQSRQTSAGSSDTAGSGTGSGDDTVTGSVAQTEWGPVQVALRVRDGAITSVDVLQSPSGNPKDVEINDYALPILVQETVDAQSASIDMVSGATVTSNGYLQSLQSALDQAGL